MPNYQTQMQKALASFAPTYLQLYNESDQHGGYTDGKESHFRIAIVAQIFIGMSKVARHRAIYTALADFLTSAGGTVHALAIFAYTPDEWARLQDAPHSPPCAHAPH